MGIMDIVSKILQFLENSNKNYENKVSRGKREYEHYKRQAETMSTEDLKERYNNLNAEKDLFKKQAYAEVLKSKLRQM